MLEIIRSNPEYLLYGVLGFAWLEYLWEAFLGFRQRKVYDENKKPPPELAEITDEATFEKARLYALDKSRFGAFHGMFSQILSTLIIWFFAYKFIWDAAKSINGNIGLSTESEIYQ